MMPSKLTPRNLCKLVDASYDKFEHLRKARVRFLNAYVGRFYAKARGGDSAMADEVRASPINLIFNAVNTLVPNLVYRDPRFKVRTDVLAFRGYADILELATTNLSKVLKFRRQLRMAIVDSLFFAGFIKTGIATTGQYITIADQDIAIGEPFAERVDPDDMILDPMARDWEQQMYVGNRFRVLRQDLLDSGLYDSDFVMSLNSRADTPHGNEARDLSGERQADEVRELMDFIDLAEIYIPRDKRVVTIPWTHGVGTDKFLRDVDYSGPDSGIYHMLGYAQVPDNLLPLPPVSMWYDLHILGNRMARKIARQADRMKRVLAYDGQSLEDAKTVVDADDGEAVRVNNVAGVKELNFGGTTEDAYGFMEWVENKFSTMANSLDSLSGNKTDAPTATQSEMLQQNTSVRLADLQNMVYDFVAEVGTDLAFFLHTDPLIRLPMVKRANGQDQQVVYSPEERQGDFINYALTVEPYSMARPDPARKVMHLMQFASNVIPAAAQAAQILGPAFKIQQFLERVASETGLEEMDEILDMPTFHDWMMAKVMQEMDPGKAVAFVTQPPIQSMPWQQGGQQAAFRQQMAALAQAHANEGPKQEPPKISVTVNFADLPLDVQQQLEQSMGFQPSSQPAVHQPPASASKQRVRVGQPNPTQRAPSPQNVNAGTEQAKAQQDVAGELRKAFPAVSTQDRAVTGG